MAVGTRLRFDGLETELATQLNPGVTTIEFAQILTSDGGIPIDTLVDDEFVVLTILDANYRLKEIVHLVEYTSEATTGTIERAQEGTGEHTHPVDSKVVHAATVTDYLLVHQHDVDPNAHAEIIALCNAYADNAVAEHNDEDFEDEPHPYFPKKTGDTFTGPMIFDGEVTFNNNVTVAEGADLNIEGDLVVTGRLFINGREIVVSNDPPGDHGANTVWIQTFG